jgi:L-asparaginase/Glu-tRNA(Gln) amidotransferase subunit D
MGRAVPVALTQLQSGGVVICAVGEEHVVPTPLELVEQPVEHRRVVPHNVSCTKGLVDLLDGAGQHVAAIRGGIRPGVARP